jgi:hypothetical protein
MQALRITGATGLEPATSGVTGRRSNQLSYAPGRAVQYGTRIRARLAECPPGYAGPMYIGLGTLLLIIIVILLIVLVF